MSYLKNIEYLIGNDKRKRSTVWSGIIIHHTGLPKKNIIDTELWKKTHKNIAKYLSKKDNNYVSCHYQIGRFGEITRIIDPENYVAFHAGKSSFWSQYYRKFVNGCNDHFIGIELLGDGNKMHFSNEQYESLSELCKNLMSKYPTISANCIVGHETVSPGRKADPGKFFNWNLFFKKLFS